VDRHVHKAGEPVDDGGEATRWLWTPSRASLGRQATRAVKNRPSMWTGGGREWLKTTDSNVHIRYSP